MAKSKKALLINSHLTYPNWTEGTLNNAFYQVAKDVFTSAGLDVLETTIEDGYNPEEEVQKHLDADIIVLQMPVNWFGAPWIYKKYVDEVFNAGLFSKSFLTGDGRTKENPTRQYGTGGKLQGKKFMICATWNAPDEAFNNPAQQLMQGKSVEDLFLNITSNYRFCGYEIIKGFNCFDIFRRTDIAKDLENYPSHLLDVFSLKRVDVTA
jgi:modulator of drug activity B